MPLPYAPTLAPPVARPGLPSPILAPGRSAPVPFVRPGLPAAAAPLAPLVLPAVPALPALAPSVAAPAAGGAAGGAAIGVGLIGIGLGLAIGNEIYEEVLDRPFGPSLGDMFFPELQPVPLPVLEPIPELGTPNWFQFLEGVGLIFSNHYFYRFDLPALAYEILPVTQADNAPSTNITLKIRWETCERTIAQDWYFPNSLEFRGIGLCSPTPEPAVLPDETTRRFRPELDPPQRAPRLPPRPRIPDELPRFPPLRSIPEPFRLPRIPRIPRRDPGAPPFMVPEPTFEPRMVPDPLLRPSGDPYRPFIPDPIPETETERQRNDDGTPRLTRTRTPDLECCPAVERLAERMRDCPEPEPCDLTEVERLLNEVLDTLATAGNGDLDVTPCDAEEPVSIGYAGSGFDGVFSAITAITTSLNAIHDNTKCEPEPCVSSVPDWWQVRKGADTPQLSIVFRKQGTRNYHSLNIPHPKVSPRPTVSAIEPYEGGQWQATIYLRDNSKFIVCAKLKGEAVRVATQAASMIEPEWLPSPLEIATTERRGFAVNQSLMEPRYMDYHPEGQKGRRALWRVRLAE